MSQNNKKIPTKGTRRNNLSEVGKPSINKAVFINFLPLFVSVFVLVFVMIASITIINKTKDEVAKFNTEVDVIYTTGLAHYSWAIALMENINNGTAFTQSLDPRGCTFGLFMYGDQTGSSDIMRDFLSSVEPYHTALHDAGSEIVNFVYEETADIPQVEIPVIPETEAFVPPVEIPVVPETEAFVPPVETSFEISDEVFEFPVVEGEVERLSNQINLDAKEQERILKLALYNEKAEPNLTALTTRIYATIELVDAAIRNAEDELDSAILQAYIFCGLVSIWVICAITYALSYIRREIVAPIAYLSRGSKALAGGDLSANFIYESKTRELTMLSMGLDSSVNNLKEVILDIEYNVGALANKDFSIYPKMNYIGDFKAIENSIAKLIDVIRDTMGEISSASGQVNTGAIQVSSSAQALASGAMEQTTSVDQLFTVVESVTGKVMETATNATEADKLGKVAVEVVAKSAFEMQELMTAISEIQETSAHIEKIIKTIDDIAFQTNILALNAAVEAARAGKAGSGFAVVADEVRNLAQKSAEAAQNTTSLISSSLQAVEKGTNLANSTNETFEEVAKNTQQVLGVVGEIAVASKEQLESIKLISNNVGEIAAVVQTNSATSEESAAASEELSSQSETMNSLISEFKLGR